MSLDKEVIVHLAPCIAEKLLTAWKILNNPELTPTQYAEILLLETLEKMEHDREIEDRLDF